MEIKNKEKILKIISMVLSILITYVSTYVYHKRLWRMILIPKSAIIITILLVMFMAILYLYIYSILKAFSNKKIIKPLLYILLLILLIVGLVFIKDNVNYILRNNILMMIFIVGVIAMPAILLGNCILQKSKYKNIKIIVVIILSVYLYVASFSYMLDYAKKIIANVTENQIEELFSLREKEKVDTTYLQNYTQKMSKQGYLDKFDITNIIDITDSKSAPIKINYKDEVENIELKVSNKNDDEIINLKESLKAEYYKFNYENNDQNNVVIDIERYKIAEKNINEEKNSNIIILGNKNSKIIENVSKYVSSNKEGFCYENKLNTNTKLNSKELYNFKLLLVYDKEIDNFVPVINSEEDINFLQDYKVYQNGIDITLQEGVTIKNKDYTLRLNRYNEKLETSKSSSFYNYEYEPVVTEMSSSKGPVLEFDFDSSYTFEMLKNIEIIFGK